MGRVLRPAVRLYARLSENKRVVRYGLLSLNVLLLVAIGMFTLRGSHPSDVLSRSVLSGGDTTDPLDQLSSADIALHASRAAALYETPAVTERADSVATELAATQADTTVVAKQQAVATVFKSRADIKEYVVQPGDTVASIAAKFSITSDSVLWSNNLRSNTVAANTKLLIPPINGIVYTTKAGDTVDTVAQRYRANREQIIAYNDIELTGIKADERILIPNGQLPVATATASRAPSGPITAVYGYNGYDYGFCTWYVANRRTQVGNPVPANLGNASTWDDRAARAGMLVNKTPSVGAAVVTSQRGAGHVAFVERVNEDGSVWISEMNSRGQVSIADSSPAGGWGRVDYKLIPAGQASSYNYIY